MNGLARCFATVMFLATAAFAEVRLLDTPAADRSGSYALNAGPDGTTVLSWVEPLDDGGHALRFAELHGDEWSDPATVASGEGWFVNWIDHPAVAPLGGGRVVAHWLVHDQDREGDYGYGIRLAFSDDRGATWREAFRASGEGADGYAGFVAYAAVADGFEMAYLATLGDDQAAAAAGSASEGARGAGHAAVEPRMTLRSARFNADGALVADRQVDADVCSCCTTAMVPGQDGLFLAFRDRREGEFRDISFARLQDDRWSSPRLVHYDGWHIRGCPTNGPALAAGETGPAVAWFTAAGGESKARAALRESGKRRRDKPVSRMLAAFWNPTEQRFDRPIRVDDGAPRGWAGVATLEDGSAAVSWVERSKAGAFQLRVRRVSPDGSIGEALIVAPVPSGRSALGVPKLVRNRDRLIFAWRDGGVRTSTMPTAAIE